MTFDKSRHHINAGGTPYIGELLEVNQIFHLHFLYFILR